MTPRPALSETFARGARAHASNAPDDVLAAAAEERALARLRRRIRWWQRLRLVR